MISDSELSAILDYEISQAEGYEFSNLAAKRELALDYYYGRLPAAPGNGRSGVVSTDVADSIHSLLASIQPIVKGTQIEFVPTHDNDTNQVETDTVQYKISADGGIEAIYAAIHDALLMDNGWIKVSVKDDTVEVEEKYSIDIPPEAILMISQPTAPNQQVKLQGYTDYIKVTRATTTQSLQFDAIAPENMLFSNDRESVEELRFVAEYKAYTVSELLDMGFSRSKVDDLPDATDYTVYNARRNPTASDDTAAQDAEQYKSVYCCYIRLDKNDNGHSALYHVWIGGSVILLKETADYIPYICGSAVPVPHKVQGMSIFDATRSIQDAKTEILRQYLDNLAVMNGSRIGAVEGQVNMGDLTNGRINGVVRMRSPDALVPLPSTDIGPQAMAGLNYMDQVRSQRVGSSLDYNDVQAQLMSAQSAVAAAGQLAQIEKMSGWYATNLINTLLRPAFLLVHKVLRNEYTQAINAKSNNKWISINPSEWQPRDNVHITMGMTSQEKAQRINALSTVIQQQQTIIQAGGNNILTALSKVYNSMSDWIRANDLESPDRYLLDPEQPEQQQAAAQQSQQAEQQRQQLVKDQQTLLQQQHRQDMAKQEAELAYKKWSDELDAEIKEAELTTDILTSANKKPAA